MLVLTLPHVGLDAFLLAALVSLVAFFWLQAALVKAVDDVRDGGPTCRSADVCRGPRASRSGNRRRDLFFGLAVASALSSSPSSVGFGGAGVAIGVIGLIAWFLLLLVWWCVVTPAIVLENKGFADGLARSRELVSGNGWAVLWVIVLAVLLLIGVAIVLSLILSPLDERVQNFVSQIAWGTVTAPFFAVVLTLLYFRLRAAKEPVAETPAPAMPGS